MSRAHQTFTAGSRVLHWAMAAMVLAMLFIGVAWRRRCPPDTRS